LICWGTGRTAEICLKKATSNIKGVNMQLCKQQPQSDMKHISIYTYVHVWCYMSAMSVRSPRTRGATEMTEESGAWVNKWRRLACCFGQWWWMEGDRRSLRIGGCDMWATWLLAALYTHTDRNPTTGWELDLPMGAW
jgi:hypothetical protein